MKKIILILSILSIGCSPQKRLNRLAENHPELFRVDTVWKYDTVRIEATIFDTILQAGITPDTVVIHDSLMTIRYYNNGKTVYLQGETKEIVKIKKIPVEVRAPIITKIIHKIPWWVWPLIIVLVILIILLAFRNRIVHWEVVKEKVKNIYDDLAGP